MRIHWKRFIWVIFICLYTALFFYNCLRPYNNWFVSYIYTMILIVWLSVEYYEKHLFFQSPFIPLDLHNTVLRVLFALFFYSSFVIGIATIVWWPKYKVGLYPLIHIIGVAALIYSVYLRRAIFSRKLGTTAEISRFYISVALFIASLAFGYGSYFLLLYVIIIGFPLVFLQYIFEKRQLIEFERFVHSKQKSNKIEAKDYENLWQKYLTRKIKKKAKE